MSERARVDIYGAAAMRAQTEAYMQAVLDAHPELRRLEPDAGARMASEPDLPVVPDGDESTAFDPYPALTTADEIMAHVSKKYGRSRRLLRFGKRRWRSDNRARWEAYYLMRVWLNLSYNWIGQYFGGRDHTTIIHGVRQHCKLNGLDYPASDFHTKEEKLDNVIDESDMPAPDQLVRYGDGSIGPAMFHYASESCSPEAIANDAGFEISYSTLESDVDGEDAWAAYESMAESASADAPSIEEVLSMWHPRAEDGWKLVGKTDTEDGPVAIFIKPITRQ